MSSVQIYAGIELRLTVVTHRDKRLDHEMCGMRTTHSNVEELRGVLAAADEPLTAREILAELEACGETTFESPHQIATVLGQWANQGGIEVITGQPYRYRLD